MSQEQFTPLNICSDSPLLRQDDSGAVRIGNTRVLLELVIRAFEAGATPEAIVQRYPSTTLADIYAVIAYYLRHRALVERYLAERERQAEALREKVESRQGDLAEVRRRLLAQRNPWPFFMLRLAADENFNGDIVRGLLFRLLELNLVRVQDVAIKGAIDPVVLAWAAETIASS